jgi:hypothetical protein
VREPERTKSKNEGIDILRQHLNKVSSTVYILTPSFYFK